MLRFLGVGKEVFPTEPIPAPQSPQHRIAVIVNTERYDSTALANGIIRAAEAYGGAACHVLFYDPEQHDQFINKLSNANYDSIVLRVTNYGFISKNYGDDTYHIKRKFEEIIRKEVAMGKPVYPTPMVSSLLNSKDIIVSIKEDYPNLCMSDSFSCYSPEELEFCLKVTAAHCPRVIRCRQSGGQSGGGSGVWFVWRQDRSYCDVLGKEVLNDNDILTLMEMCDGHVETHTVQEFVNFCCHGKNHESSGGGWKTQSDGDYFRDGGGGLVDMRLVKGCSENGFVTLTMVGTKVLKVNHHIPNETASHRSIQGYRWLSCDSYKSLEWSHGQFHEFKPLVDQFEAIITPSSHGSHDSQPPRRQSLFDPHTTNQTIGNNTSLPATTTSLLVNPIQSINYRDSGNRDDKKNGGNNYDEYDDDDDDDDDDGQYGGTISPTMRMFGAGKSQSKSSSSTLTSTAKSPPPPDDQAHATRPIPLKHHISDREEWEKRLSPEEASALHSDLNNNLQTNITSDNVEEGSEKEASWTARMSHRNRLTGGLSGPSPVLWTAHFLPHKLPQGSGWVLHKIKCDCVDVGNFDVGKGKPLSEASYDSLKDGYHVADLIGKLVIEELVELSSGIMKDVNSKIFHSNRSESSHITEKSNSDITDNSTHTKSPNKTQQFQDNKDMNSPTQGHEHSNNNNNMKTSINYTKYSEMHDYEVSKILKQSDFLSNFSLAVSDMWQLHGFENDEYIDGIDSDITFTDHNIITSLKNTFQNHNNDNNDHNGNNGRSSHVSFKPSPPPSPSSTIIGVHSQGQNESPGYDVVNSTKLLNRLVQYSLRPDAMKDMHSPSIYQQLSSSSPSSFQQLQQQIQNKTNNKKHVPTDSMPSPPSSPFNHQNQNQNLLSVGDIQNNLKDIGVLSSELRHKQTLWLLTPRVLLQRHHTNKPISASPDIAYVFIARWPAVGALHFDFELQHSDPELNLESLTLADANDLYSQGHKVHMSRLPRTCVLHEENIDDEDEDDDNENEENFDDEEDNGDDGNIYENTNSTNQRNQIQLMTEFNDQGYVVVSSLTDNEDEDSDHDDNNGGKGGGRGNSSRDIHHEELLKRKEIETKLNMKFREKKNKEGGGSKDDENNLSKSFPAVGYSNTKGTAHFSDCEFVTCIPILIGRYPTSDTPFILSDDSQNNDLEKYNREMDFQHQNNNKIKEEQEQDNENEDSQNRSSQMSDEKLILKLFNPRPRAGTSGTLSAIISISEMPPPPPPPPPPITLPTSSTTTINASTATVVVSDTTNEKSSTENDTVQVKKGRDSTHEPSSSSADASHAKTTSENSNHYERIARRAEADCLALKAEACVMEDEMASLTTQIDETNEMINMLPDSDNDITLQSMLNELEVKYEVLEEEYNELLDAADVAHEVAEKAKHDQDEDRRQQIEIENEKKRLEQIKLDEENEKKLKLEKAAEEVRIMKLKQEEAHLLKIKQSEYEKVKTLSRGKQVVSFVSPSFYAMMNFYGNNNHLNHSKTSHHSQYFGPNVVHVVLSRSDLMTPETALAALTLNKHLNKDEKTSTSSPNKNKHKTSTSTSIVSYAVADTILVVDICIDILSLKDNYKTTLKSSKQTKKKRNNHKNVKEIEPINMSRIYRTVSFPKNETSLCVHIPLSKKVMKHVLYYYNKKLNKKKKQKYTNNQFQEDEDEDENEGMFVKVRIISSHIYRPISTKTKLEKNKKKPSKKDMNLTTTPLAVANETSSEIAEESTLDGTILIGKIKDCEVKLLPPQINQTSDRIRSFRNNSSNNIEEREEEYEYEEDYEEDEDEEEEYEDEEEQEEEDEFYEDQEEEEEEEEGEFYEDDASIENDRKDAISSSQNGRDISQNEKKRNKVKPKPRNSKKNELIKQEEGEEQLEEEEEIESELAAKKSELENMEKLISQAKDDYVKLVMGMNDAATM